MALCAHDIPVEVIAYCLMTEFENEQSISFDSIRVSLGAYLCLSNDKLDIILNQKLKVTLINRC